MAINFPPNPEDKSIHIDPASGLKYIFNGSIGAWEAAIQPPVIIKSPDEPQMTLEGFLWWNDEEDRLYIYRAGDWIPVIGDGGSGGLGVPVVCAPVPPKNAVEGWLWWHSVEGNMYVYYEDEPELPISGVTGSSQWVPVTTTGTNVNGTGGAIVSVIPPTNPKNGQLWFNTDQNVLYVYDSKNGKWEASISLVSGVSSLRSDGTILVDTGTVSTSQTPLISIVDSTVNRKGAIRIADVGISNTDNTRAVTPKYLSDRGITRTVTGSVILFAGDIAPEGYLICNGDIITSDNTTVQGKTINTSNLYSLLGTKYSSTTDVRLPNLSLNGLNYIIKH